MSFMNLPSSTTPDIYLSHPFHPVLDLQHQILSGLEMATQLNELYEFVSNALEVVEMKLGK